MVIRYLPSWEGVGGVSVVDVGLFIGCMMYHHTVEIVPQILKWPVLVVQVL